MRMRIITKEQDENEISKKENQNNWKEQDENEISKKWEWE